MADRAANGTQALLAACRAGDVARVSQLHQGGVTVQPWDFAFAIEAAKNGHADVLDYLAGAGLRLDGIEADLIAAAPEESRARVAEVMAKDQARLSELNKLVAQLLQAVRDENKDEVKQLHERGAQPGSISAASRADLHAMRMEMAVAAPIYRPSKFWDFFNDSNMRFLAWGGEANFKRTLNQNYFNFIPERGDDPKVAQLDALERSLGGVPHGDYALDDPDFDPALWWSWYESYLLFKGDRPARLALYKRFVACLYEYALRHDPLRLLEDHEEPALGNPIGLRRRGKLVSQDLASSAVELNFMAGVVDFGQTKWIAELGAGYGRVGALLADRYPIRYAIFDIPPALHVSQWYLSNLFPTRQVFRFRHFDAYEEIAHELAGAQLAFFTPNQLELLPDRFFEASLTISSLHEMRLEQVTHYLQLLARKTRHAMYLKQQWQYVNPHDGITVRESDYAAPRGWRTTLERTDPLNPEFFERVMLRQETLLGRLARWLRG